MVKQMSGDKKLELTRLTDNNITIEEFENDMSIIKKALDKCWTECYD